jgi:TPR repeat protein
MVRMLLLRRALVPGAPSSARNHGVVLSWLIATVALSGALSGCTSEVALRPAKSCDGGSIAHCRVACDRREARACYRLGWLHEEGVGVRRDVKRAITLYDQACSLNWAVACRALGIMYWRGEDVQRRPKRAIAYFDKACNLGLAEACPSNDMRAEADGRKNRGFNATVTTY